jgi:hypothetical protein
VSKVFVVEATVHKPVGNAYRVKISILDIGVYINGMMVYPPNTDRDSYLVLTPAQRAGRGKYAHIVEFNKKLPLWGEVADACIDAVKLYASDSQQDTVITDIPDEPINLDDIPF